MTVRYVASTGSNTSPYDTWAKACTTPKTVTDLMGAGDITYIKNETFTISADTTYTLAGTIASPAQLISTSDTTNNPPTSVATGCVIDGSGTNGVDITLLGKAYIYGVSFKSGNGAVAGHFTAATSDDDNLVLEECAVTISNTASGSRLTFGSTSSASNNYVITKNCTFTTGNNAGQALVVACPWNDTGSTFAITTTVPTTYVGSAQGYIKFTGSDFSAITTSIFGGTMNKKMEIIFAQCKLGSGVAILAAQTGPAHADAYVYDCATGDTHYEFAHYNYFGNTTISTAIYMSGTDGASYNAANSKHSWKITGTANTTFQQPYISPWLSVYNEATAAVTPRLEILRDGSTTAYNNDEVWGEWLVKATSGSTRSTCYSDRRGLADAAAAQGSSALGASDWAGETTPWYGKLEPTATITPAEIGDISARVMLAGNITVYVNPKILGI